MDVASVAIRSLLPKLAELLGEQYKLHMDVKEDVQFLSRELSGMQAALRKVAEVPRDQLDEQDNLWADQLRDLSYSLEDVVDTFLVRIEGPEPVEKFYCFNWLADRLGRLIHNWLDRGIARQVIAREIKRIKVQVEAVAAQRDRYRVSDGVVANSAAARPTTVDPRLRALYAEAAHLVGIDGQMDQELIRLLCLGGESDVLFEKNLKVVSIVGFGGLGKTTLAKAVYSKIEGDFDCTAFVPVGRNAGVKKILMDILIDLCKPDLSLTMLDERQLIDRLREFLGSKRYLIVIDDIWDEKLWGFIKLAFSNTNNLGSRVITTTRIGSVSKACCTSSNDSVFPMKPLNDDDSKKLFYKRIFPHDSGCPSEFDRVSREILKKCGGVPMAIITIASILASDQQIKPEYEWHVLLKSIGCGLTEDASVEEMERIISYSYHDLPSHLKTCLLYLSMFPEDHEIKRDRLIWMWIAEGFFQCENQETSLFELGETYFNELVNRNMIQPVYNHIGKVQACRVHDMVHDFICSLSYDQNFVIILGRTSRIRSSHINVRRLSLQYRKEDHQGIPHASISMSQLRSMIIFPHAIHTRKITPSFICIYRVLRVLDMSGCYLEGRRGYPWTSDSELRQIGCLVHLRYLSLAGTHICTLPAEIGMLQFLQVLNIRHNLALRKLPSSIFSLRRLMRLHIDGFCTGLPDGLGNLTSIEVLDNIRASMNIVKEMHNLTRLRDLSIDFYDCGLELEKAFVESLCNLHNIQSLTIHGRFPSMDILGERWVPPRHLRRFKMYCLHSKFSALPAWLKINHWLLSDLSELLIAVTNLNQEDLGILGNLPALRCLRMESTYQTQTQLVIGADGFRSMISFSLICRSPKQIVFLQGALPRAQKVDINFSPHMAKDAQTGDFDLGLGNLPSLRAFHVRFLYSDGPSLREAEQFQGDLWRAKAVHPNHPRILSEIKPIRKPMRALPAPSWDACISRQKSMSVGMRRRRLDRGLDNRTMGDF